MNRVVTFVIGLVVGLGAMALIGTRERASAEAVHAKELDAARQDVCQSLGYHHAERINERWTCMDVEPDEDEHDHDHADQPES